MSLAQRQRAEHVAVALRFLGGRPNVEPQGVERAAGVVNDLRGNDPSQWRRGIPQYRDVVYRDLWPGIDLRLRDQSGVLKYEFHVRPAPHRRTSSSPTAAPTASRSATTAGSRSRPLPACCGRADLLPGHRRRAGAGDQLDVLGRGANAAAGSRSPSATTSATTSW